MISKAIQKYGKENFIVEEIDTAESLEELNKKEAEWIDKLEALKKGYNIRPGGNNSKLSEEIKI